MIVLISRELGAGGGTVGEALATALDAALLDERWFIEQLGQRCRYPNDYLERMLERPPKFGESLVATLARATAMMPGTQTMQMPDEQLIDTARTMVLEQARTRHVVAIGHGGAGMLGWRPKNTPVVAILLQAGRNWRIKQLARRFSIDLDEAAKRIKTTDDARVKYQKHYFNSNMYDCSLYDLVLNTEVLGLDNAVQVAKAAVLALFPAQPSSTSESVASS
jgi:cytidylate kinase